jgi:hypothetical protein
VTMKWETPPEAPGKHTTRQRVLSEEAAELREHPGHWAVMRVYPNAEGPTAKILAANIKNGNYAAFRPRRYFEAEAHLDVATDNGIRAWKVYARYIGPPGEARCAIKRAEAQD